MSIRRRKNLLWIWLIITLLVSVGTVSIAVSASTAVLSASVITDTTLIPGETFHINITVANVENLWGYQFVVYYNTSVLTATSNVTYDPFTWAWPCEINDTAGYVMIAYSMQPGEKVGFSTVESVPIARIDFTVDALGTTTLELSGWEPEKWTKLSGPAGEVILHDVYDGFFANIAVEDHDIAITDVTASPTTVLVNENETVTVTVVTENQGDFDETFNVSAYYDSVLIESPTSVTLSAGDSETLTFSWDTAGVSTGNYTIKAVVPPVPGEVRTVDNTFTDGMIAIVEEEQASSFVLYAAAGIAIVVVAIVLVYFLKVRKPT